MAFHFLISKKNKRSSNVLYGALSLSISQVLVSLIGFILTGILARYFMPDEFGLWSLAISLTGILAGFDLGFCNALRNKLAQVYARKIDENREGQIYFLSLFYWFLFWALCLNLVAIVLKPYVPWGALFNSNKISVIKEGSLIFVIGIAISAINLAFSIGSAGFFSYQESHWIAVFSLLPRFLILIVTILFIYLHLPFFPITVMFFLLTLLSSAVSAYFFLHRRKWKIIFINIAIIWQKIQELWNKSFQFALLQLFGALYISLDIFLVSKIFGLEMAGEYSIVKKLYVLFGCVHFCFLMPIWSAYTEAVELRDFEWVEKIIKKSAFYTIIAFVAATIIFTIFGNSIVYLWTGKHITNMLFYFILGIYSLIFGWVNCFSVFLNSIGKLKTQIILFSLGSLCLIPFSLYLSRTFGLIGICYALVITVIPLAISNPIQSYFFIKNKQ